jgi:hypothetical protein
VVTLGAALVVAGSALPWGGTGRVDRSGFELAGVAGRLDLVSGAAAALAGAWALAPLVLAVVVVAAVARRPAVAAGLAIALAAAGTALATLVLRSPLAARPGVAVTIVGAGVVVIGAADSIRTHRPAADRDGPPTGFAARTTGAGA